jgi:hypothetical protein
VLDSISFQFASFDRLIGSCILEVLEATKVGLQEVKRDLQEQEGKELMAQQEAAKYKDEDQERPGG